MSVILTLRPLLHFYHTGREIKQGSRFQTTTSDNLWYHFNQVSRLTAPSGSE
jgi:hypothetical protein